MFSAGGLFGSEDNTTSVVEEPARKLPPADGDEWLTREGLSEVFPVVPDGVVHQYTLDYHAETLVGTEEEISETLTGELDLDFSDLEMLASELEQLQQQINQLHILNAPCRTRTRLTQGDLLRGSSAAPDTNAHNGLSRDQRRGPARGRQRPPDQVVEPDPSLTQGQGRARPGHRRGRQGEQPRGITTVKFPGFVADEPASLPAVVEAPELLNEPVTHLNVSDDFRRRWRHVMTCEMSVLLLQDCFWWLFLEHFNPNPVDQDKLFGRISDTFVCMLETSGLVKFKGGVFQLYPHCMAQSLLFAFCRMFPSSRPLFDEDFRTEIANTVWTWIAGIKCPARFHWSSWPLDELGANRHMTPVPSAIGAVAHTNALKSLRILKTDELSGGARKGLQRQPTARTRRLSSALGSHSTGREVCSALRKPLSRPVSGLTSRGSSAGEHLRFADTSESRPATAPHLSQFENIEEQLSTDKWLAQFNRKEQESKVESHPIRLGTEYNFVVFDNLGRSPLVDHYLKMHKTLGKRTRPMLRSEMIPNRDGPKKTFNDALVETQAFAKRLEDSYRHAVEEHAQRNAELKAEYVTAKKFIERDAREKCEDIMRRRRLATSDVLVMKPP